MRGWGGGRILKRLHKKAGRYDNGLLGKNITDEKRVKKSEACDTFETT